MALAAAQAAALSLSANTSGGGGGAAAAAATVELPSYYNPAAINVAKYANQIQKRKLLWSNKNPQQNADKWQQQAQFSKDEDGKVASKFMRLMGIKKGGGGDAVAEDGAGTEAPPPTTSEEQSKKPNDFARKQSDLLSKMEHQYEVARQATHTMRGMGLGFSRPY